MTRTTHRENPRTIDADHDKDKSSGILYQFDARKCSFFDIVHHLQLEQVSKNLHLGACNSLENWSNQALGVGQSASRQNDNAWQVVEAWSNP